MCVLVRSAMIESVDLARRACARSGRAQECFLVTASLSSWPGGTQHRSGWMSIV
jgi:hypothetical protein